jgi:abortive infection bacteriophage resistance protein
MVKSSPIFKRKGAHLVEKKMFQKNKDCSLSIWVLWTCKDIFDMCQAFEHVNFAINEKIQKTFMIIQTIMFPLWYFKHTKM